MYCCGLLPLSPPGEKGSFSVIWKELEVFSLLLAFYCIRVFKASYGVLTRLGLESPWKLQSVLKSPCISVLTKYTKSSRHRKTFRINLFMLWKNVIWQQGLSLLICPVATKRFLESVSIYPRLIEVICLKIWVKSTEGALPVDLCLSKALFA